MGNLALGGLMIECSNDTINLELQLRASEDLRTTWSNAGDAVEWQMQTPPDKHFYQVTGSE